MDRDVGVVRNADGLNRAIDRLNALRREGRGSDAEDHAAIALLIARAALRRTESRGAHFRADAGPSAEPPAHSASQWDELKD
jgi:L-aspartate oxidase